MAEELWSGPMNWKPLILCVDDTPSILVGQKMLLEEHGYRVLTATNGNGSCASFRVAFRGSGAA